MTSAELLHHSNNYLLLARLYHDDAMRADTPALARAFDRAADLAADMADTFAEAARAVEQPELAFA